MQENISNHMRCRLHSALILNGVVAFTLVGPCDKIKGIKYIKREARAAPLGLVVLFLRLHKLRRDNQDA
ncbi:hypothetical protein SAMN05518848_112134 [Paenibacillus sp. PDC88]|nr:hypothetical protein SAMN05518848_112134 [Paenibacillus sp. PDC88]